MKNIKSTKTILKKKEDNFEEKWKKNMGKSKTKFSTNSILKK
jgi:hypothetical protein